MTTSLLNYRVVSPSGIAFNVLAETIFHAINIVVGMENYQYTNAEYLKLKPKYNKYSINTPN